MVGLFAFLVTHFLVLLGIFPGALVVVFSGTLEVRLAEGLVASSPGSQASGSLPRLGIQLQLKGSEMESRPGVPGDAGGEAAGETADTVRSLARPRLLLSPPAGGHRVPKHSASPQVAFECFL